MHPGAVSLTIFARPNGTCVRRVRSGRSRSSRLPVLGSRKQRAPRVERSMTAYRSIRWCRRRVCLAIAAVLVGLTVAACGGDEKLVRQDYYSVIAPERCGGVSSVSCAGYQTTPTPTGSQ